MVAARRAGGRRLCDVGARPQRPARCLAVSGGSCRAGRVCGSGLRYLGNFGRFGDCSYGIYIVHFPLLQVLVSFGLFRVNPWLGLGAATLGVLALAALSWHFVEKPFLRRITCSQRHAQLAVPLPVTGAASREPLDGLEQPRVERMAALRDRREFPLRRGASD